MQDSLAEKKHCRQTEKIIARILDLGNRQKNKLTKRQDNQFFILLELE